MTRRHLAGKRLLVGTVLRGAAVIDGKAQPARLAVARQTLFLVLHQGVERIEEDSLDGVGASLLAEIPDDRVHEALGLTGARTRGDDDGLAVPEGLPALRLVLIGIEAGAYTQFLNHSGIEGGAPGTVLGRLPAEHTLEDGLGQ